MRIYKCSPLTSKKQKKRAAHRCARLSSVTIAFALTLAKRPRRVTIDRGAAGRSNRSVEPTAFGHTLRVPHRSALKYPPRVPRCPFFAPESSSSRYHWFGSREATQPRHESPVTKLDISRAPQVPLDPLHPASPPSRPTISHSGAFHAHF